MKSTNIEKIKACFRSADNIGNGQISKQTWERILHNLPQEERDFMWDIFDKNQQGSIMFDEFVNWAATNKDYSDQMVSLTDVAEILHECGVRGGQERQILCKLEGKSLTTEEIKQQHELDGINDTITSALKVLFDECDEDEDGIACGPELVNALEMYVAIGRECGFPQIIDDFDRAYVERFFREADENSDEKLSFNEFYNHMIRLMKDKMGSVRKRLIYMRSSLTADSVDAQSDPFVNTPKNAKIKLLDWQMNYWELTDKEEFDIVVQSFRQFKCLNISGMCLGLDTFNAFFFAIRDAYNDVPYHNIRHALSTVHYTCKLVGVAGIHDLEEFRDEDSLALILSSLCHDVGHRGRNSSFEVQTMSDLAILYNDKSVLENHHCALAFQIALRSSSDKCNIFKGWKREKFNLVRQCIVSNILATDMGFHHDLVKKLGALKNASDDIRFLSQVFVHSADIGSVLMPTDTAARWTKALQEEFTAQVVEERRLGIPVSTFMEGLDDPARAAKDRIYFIDFVATPLFDPLFRIYPDLSEARDNMNKHRKDFARRSSV